MTTSTKTLQEDRDVLADNMCHARIARGWTQADLAKVAKLHRTYIGGLEQSVRNPSLQTLVKIAVALDCSVADLLTPNNYAIDFL